MKMKMDDDDEYARAQLPRGLASLGFPSWLTRVRSTSTYLFKQAPPWIQLLCHYSESTGIVELHSIHLIMSQTKSTPSASASNQHPDQEGSWMPKPILQFYSKFPLIVLPAETSSIVEKIGEPTLWVSLPSPRIADSVLK